MKMIKRKLLFVCLALIGVGVRAQTMTSGAMAAPTASSTAGNQEFYQGITFNSPGESRSKIEYSGTQTVKNVPSVSGPPLTTSNDTCMGSSSGGVNGPGFGISVGSTWTDNNCKILKNSRELWNMGMKAASLALMCSDALNREALEITGFECPQSARDRKVGDRSNAATPGPALVTEAALVSQRQMQVSAPVEKPVAGSQVLPPLSAPEAPTAPLGSPAMAPAVLPAESPLTSTTDAAAIGKPFAGLMTTPASAPSVVAMSVLPVRASLGELPATAELSYK